MSSQTTPAPRFAVGQDVHIMWTNNSHTLYMTIQEVHEFKIWPNTHAEINAYASNPRREYSVIGLTYTVPEEWIQPDPTVGENQVG